MAELTKCTIHGCNSCQEKLEEYKQRPVIVCRFKHNVNLIPEEITIKEGGFINTTEMMFFRSSGTSNPRFKKVFENTFLPLLGLGILIHNNENKILVHKYFHKYCTIQQSIKYKIKSHGFEEWSVSLNSNKTIKLDPGLTSEMITILCDMYCICWEMLRIIAYINIHKNDDMNFFRKFPKFSEFIIDHQYDGKVFKRNPMGNPFKQVYKHAPPGHQDIYNSLQCGVNGKLCQDDIRTYDSDLHVKVWALSTAMLNKIKDYMNVFVRVGNIGFISDMRLQPYFELFNDEYRDQFAREVQGRIKGKKTLELQMESFERRMTDVVKKIYTYNIKKGNNTLKRSRSGSSTNGSSNRGNGKMARKSSNHKSHKGPVNSKTEQLSEAHFKQFRKGMPNSPKSNSPKGNSRKGNSPKSNLVRSVRHKSSSQQGLQPNSGSMLLRRLIESQRN